MNENKGYEYEKQVMDIIAGVAIEKEEKQRASSTQKRPKSSQNFFLKSTNIKMQLRPSSKQKIDEKNYLSTLPSDKMALINSQQKNTTISIYPRRSNQGQRKMQVKLIKKGND